MSGQGLSAKLAKLDLAMRSERRVMFGTEVLPPSGWDLILVLYIADAESRRLTVRETIERAGGCLEAGRRLVAYLSRSGVIVGDGSGKLDDVVTLSPEYITRVEQMIERSWTQVQAVEPPDRSDTGR